MSEDSAKRLKIPAMGSEGVSIIESLPTELLEIIVGSLDVRTLCTARCVCRLLCTAASRCIPSVQLSVKTLRRRPETTLDNFPNLKEVSVFDVNRDDLRMLAQSPVGVAVTHLRAVEYLRLVPRRGRNAAGPPPLPLPNLTSLTVRGAGGSPSEFPQTLRELTLERSIPQQTANLVTMLTNLTCLHMDGSGMRTTFEAVTALTVLQRLEISSNSSIIPFVAELTLLTYLQFQERGSPLPPAPSVLTSLTSLQRLVHLGVKLWSACVLDETVLQASISTITSLRSLDLTLCQRPHESPFETVCMAPFSQLTALRLEISSLVVPFLHRFNLERLQDLSLSYGVRLNRDGVAALTRATGLTRLQLCTSTLPASAGPPLSHMSRLRALFLNAPARFQAVSLATPSAVPATFSLKAISNLTELSRLELSGRGVTTNADAEVILGLKKLRVLRMFASVIDAPLSERITHDTFLAIAKLPELHKLEMIGVVEFSRGDLTDEAQAGFNAERLDKGWPPLELELRP